MQTGNADQLTVVRFIADARHLTERWFHQHYSDSHIVGGWFRYCETMLTLEPPSTLEDATPQPRSAIIKRDAIVVFAAARAANIQLGGNRWSKSTHDNGDPVSISEAITKYGVSRSAIERAKTILVCGSPADEDDVISGRVSLSAKAFDLASKRVLKSRLQSAVAPGVRSDIGFKNDDKAAGRSPTEIAEELDISRMSLSGAAWLGL